MTNRFTKRILDHMADSRYRPQQIRELASALNIDAEDYDEFARAVSGMIEGGQVVIGSAQTIALPPVGKEMVGRFRLSDRGFGFVIPDAPMEHGDLFVPAGNTGNALTGDRVRAEVVPDPRRRRGAASKSPFIGRVVEIIQRADRHYVGNLIRRGGTWLVQVDGKLLHDPVVIRDPHAKNAKEGDKVVIELIHYPQGSDLAEGVIIEVLGEGGEPEVETRAVMRAYGLAEKFPAIVMDQARQAASTFDDKAIPPDREDLTGSFIITIDPPDARDFDDALSLTELEGEGDAAYELGVHIADVAHFVRPGTELDNEAAARGNSAYLPRKVVPMLPELLSNGVCSLQEGVNRFCKSVFIRYDREGNVLGARFARTVIRSAKRLTYLEAQALIDGDLREARKHARTEPKYGGPLIKTLKMMDELAKAIRQRRMNAGMIVLDLPEVELVFDDTGRVIDAVPEDDAFTHKLIEAFMVEANEAVARLFDAHEVPMIRRIHPDPDVHDLGELREFARVAGYNIPSKPSRKELQQLLDAVRGKPQQRAVHLAVLKTLSKAEYAPLIIGHFALASEHYTHFTSPIRRYPDLVVHRGLDAWLDVQHAHSGTAGGGKKKKNLTRAFREDKRLFDEVKLNEIARHCSTTERNAENAERDLRTYLVLELLAEALGDDFDGTVTGVTGSGLFVQLDRYLVEGFVRLNDLPGDPGDRWKLNERSGSLVAQRSGRTIAIGDRFTIRIAKVDPIARRLDVVIIEDRPGTGRKKRRQPKGARTAQAKTKQLKQKRTPERRNVKKKRRRR